jgi:hypothetical protein
MALPSFSSCWFNFVGSIGFVSLIPYFKRAFGAGDHVIGVHRDGRFRLAG